MIAIIIPLLNVSQRISIFFLLSVISFFSIMTLPNGGVNQASHGVSCMMSPHVRYQDSLLKSQNDPSAVAAQSMASIVASSSSAPSSMNAKTTQANITVRPYRHLRVLGRHVCTLSKVITKPIKHMESYCKPVYKTYMHPCEKGQQQQQRLCSSLRVTYEIGYRTIVKVSAQTENHYSCCPGWAQKEPSAQGCLAALCSTGCQNGGSCSKPDQCECPPGWTGQACEEDVDECHEDIERCEHGCVNTQGSYRCTCHKGFILQSDGRSCKLNLNKIPEYREFLDGYETLIKKVTRLEKMEHNIAILEHKLEDLATKQENLNKSLDSIKEWNDSTVSSSNAVGGQDEYYGSPSDMINSLSEQISMLEERLGSCMCGTERERSRFS